MSNRCYPTQVPDVAANNREAEAALQQAVHPHRRAEVSVDAGGQTTLQLGRGEIPLPEPLGAIALALRYQRVQQMGAEGWLFRGRHAGTHITADTLRGRLKRYGIERSTEGSHGGLLALAARLPAPILAERIGIHQARAARWVRLAGATYADYVQIRSTRPAASSPE